MRRLRWLMRLVVVLVGFAGACATPEPAPADVLLFTGRGTSPGDVAALEDILRGRGLRYATASSAQLDAIGERALGGYRLLVIPGGNFVDVGNGLATATTGKVRRAVGNGMGYLGICAGAFFAGASPYNGLNLTNGVMFPFYALEQRGIRKAPVLVNTAGGAAIEVYWEDGPQLAGWGQPVARYPDATPAVVQGRFGDGWVVLAGIHPEAPESWRRGLAFTRPADPSLAFAATLVDAALNRTSLPPN